LTGCACVFVRAWQIAIDQARAIRMAGHAGIPGAPPPYSATGTTYVQAYPGPNGGYYGAHPPPYGTATLMLIASELCFAAVFFYQNCLVTCGQLN